MRIPGEFSSCNALCSEYKCCERISLSSGPMTWLNAPCQEAMDTAWDAPFRTVTAVLGVIDDRRVTRQGSTIQGGVMIPADASPLLPAPTGTSPLRTMNRSTQTSSRAAMVPNRTKDATNGRPVSGGPRPIEEWPWGTIRGRSGAVMW